MNSSRVKLVVIFSMFLGPLVVAFFWYYGLSASFIPSGKTNHAPLVSPLTTLTQFTNSSVDGEPFHIESLKHRWTVIHTLPDVCGGRCEKALYNTRQTRLALGKDADRLQRVLLSGNRELLNRLAASHIDAVLLLTTEGGIQDQLAAVIRKQNSGPDDALLIDPLGNIMMVIPVELDPGLLLKDLKRLLKVSRIG
jgi:cytochrome oxidase Cu insertion factor (SCO1/SenC/PrrC family)